MGEDGLSRNEPRVLLVRPSALGDVCRTVPALVTLRQSLPQAQIDWLVSDVFTDVIRHHPDVDGVVAFRRSSWSSPANWGRASGDFWTWARSLRAHRYDLVIDFQGLARSGLITWLTGAPQRIGFANAREFGHLGYNRKHWVDRKLHSVDRMLTLLAGEGYKARYDMHLYVGEEDASWRDELLDDRPYICLAPTARWKCKCWPMDHYIQLARRLLAEGLCGEALVILSAPSERPQIRPLIEALGDDPRVLAPSTSVGQMMALISCTRRLVCNDSGPMHIAVGFDRPITAIFGPTDPGLIGPYRRDDAVIRPTHVDPNIGYRHRKFDQSVIAQITVEQVFERILDQVR